MSTRDRAGQTATATGAYAFNLAGGTVIAADMLLFEQAFQVPTVAQLPGTYSWYDVPVLVKPTSGAAAGEWALMYCTLKRDGSGGLTLTSSADNCVSTSDFNNTTKVFTALSIANTDTVEVYCVPIGNGLLDVRGRTRISDPVNSPGSHSSLDALRVVRAPAALLAVGQGAAAGTATGGAATGAVAIGDGARAIASFSYALGYQASVGSSFYKYSAVLGGYGAYPAALAQTVSGVSIIELLQGGTTPVFLELIHGKGVLCAVTTNATPVVLQMFSPETAGAPDTPAVAGSEELYMESGITTFEGVLTAFNPANGDAKRWFTRFAVKVSTDYTTTTLFGSIDKGTPQNDAGAAAWDFDVIPDPGGSNFITIEVTGAAATEIAWHFTYSVAYHVTYI
jgi:hypothetical protein